MTEFPIIHTNIWDAVWAIPVIMLLLFLLKLFLHVPPKYMSTCASVIGLFISIFISHPNNFSAGIFMGFFYGAAAFGTYISIKTTLQAYRTD